MGHENQRKAMQLNSADDTKKLRTLTFTFIPKDKSLRYAISKQNTIATNYESKIISKFNLII